MASTSLSRNTWGTATNDKIFTMSVWVKRSGLGYQQIANSYDGSTGNDNQLRFQSTDAVELTVSTSGAEYYLKTNRLFRDTSAWYHIVFAFDSTQATASDRYKLYVNGTQETSFSSVSYPPQNTTYQFFRNSNANNIGSQWGASGGFFNGSMAHYHFTDGTAYDASAFGETDATTGIWKPKTVPSVTYGTNGFFLKFENSGSMGTDSSGNGNNFTVNGNLTQTQDTPSNVFATLNSLYNNFSNNTYSNGNLKIVAPAAWSAAVGTLAVSKGKWYWELKLSNTITNHFIGVQTINVDLTTINPQQRAGTLVLHNNDGGIIYKDNTNIGGTYGTFSSGDIAGMALDMDAGSYGQLTIYKNGVAIASNIDLSSTNNGAILPFSAILSSTNEYNFGNGYFGTTAVASAQSPDDGIGIFEYTVPTGYKALCTKSINAQEYS